VGADVGAIVADSRRLLIKNKYYGCMKRLEITRAFDDDLIMEKGKGLLGEGELGIENVPTMRHDRRIANMVWWPLAKFVSKIPNSDSNLDFIYKTQENQGKSVNEIFCQSVLRSQPSPAV